MHRNAALAVLALLTAVTAERVARPVRTTLLGVAVTDGRVAALADGGFAVLEGTKIVARDADGKNPRELHHLKSAPDGWWLNPSGTRVAWNSDGRLHQSGPDRTFEVGAAASTGVAFSPDGARAAALCDGQLVVFSADGADPASLPPGERHAWSGSPAWTRDGATLLVAHGLPGRPSDLYRIEAGKMLTAKDVLYSATAGSIGAIAVSPDAAVVLDNDRVMRIPLDGGDAEEIARGELLSELAVTPEGTETIFSARAANGRRSAFTVGMARMGTRNGFPVDLLAFAERGDVSCPVPAGNESCWILVGTADGRREVALARNR